MLPSCVLRRDWEPGIVFWPAALSVEKSVSPCRLFWTADFWFISLRYQCTATPFLITTRPRMCAQFLIPNMTGVRSPACLEVILIPNPKRMWVIDVVNQRWGLGTLHMGKAIPALYLDDWRCCKTGSGTVVRPWHKSYAKQSWDREVKGSFVDIQLSIAMLWLAGFQVWRLGCTPCPFLLRIKVGINHLALKSRHAHKSLFIIEGVLWRAYILVMLGDISQTKPHRAWPREESCHPSCL